MARGKAALQQLRQRPLQRGRDEVVEADIGQNLPPLRDHHRGAEGTEQRPTLDRPAASHPFFSESSASPWCVFFSSSALVVLRDEAVEEADAEGRRTLWHGRRVLLRPGRAGDVEMRPRHLVDEALQELRRGDAAGIAPAADVLDICGIAVAVAVVGIGERHAPELLADLLAGGEETIGELVVVGEEPGMLMAERDDDGT